MPGSAAILSKARSLGSGLSSATSWSGWPHMNLRPLDYEGGSLNAGEATTGRGSVQSRTANAPTQSRPLPILPGACHAAGSGPANERPTNDQWHDHHAGRSCHLPATTWSGWPDLNRRPLRPENRVRNMLWPVRPDGCQPRAAPVVVRTTPGWMQSVARLPVDPR